MKRQILLAIFLFLNESAYCNIWEQIANKNWQDKNNKSTEIIFFQNSNGLKKAIIQVHEKNYIFYFSYVYDIEIMGETLLLKNRLALNSYSRIKNSIKKKLPNDKFYLKSSDILSSGNKDFIQLNSNPGILNSIERYSGLKFIPLEKLVKIPLKYNSIYDFKDLNWGPNPENCGIDNNVLLSDIEANFLQEYLLCNDTSGNFKFKDKRICFITGNSGDVPISKNAYFEDVKFWKENYNNRIATSLIILEEKDRLQYGYDAVITCWMKKVFTPESIGRFLENRNKTLN